VHGKYARLLTGLTSAWLRGRLERTRGARRGNKKHAINGSGSCGSCPDMSTASPTVELASTSLHDNAIALYVALFITLLFARGMAELAARFKQPFVLGELITGILLGNTVLGRIWPAAFAYMYLPSHPSTVAFNGVTSFCATMFMLVAGLELDLIKVKKLFATSLVVGLSCIIIPFALGFSVAYAQPAAMGLPPGGNVTGYALFLGVALAITALPVAAKTLRDLGLYQTEMGTIVMSAAAIDDVLGWSIFSVVLVINGGDNPSNGLGVGGGVALSIMYVVFVITLGHMATNRALPLIQAYFTWPGSTLGFVVSLALGSASFALWVGLHNTLGAFIVGVAVGNSPRFRASTREIVDQVVTFVLSPLFFGSVCIQVDIISSWDTVTVFSVFLLGCAGKLVGGYIGSRIGRSDHIQASAIAVCMNSRGAMELILAGVAIDVGIIDGRCFVALVFLAIVTSVMPGPLIRRILKRKDPISFLNYIARVINVRDTPHIMSRRDALVLILTEIGLVSSLDVATAAFDKDPHAYSEGRFAVPRMRLSAVKRPIVVVFVALGGVDMRPDCLRPSQIVILLLLPPKASAVRERELAAEIEGLLENCPALRSELFEVERVVEVMALVRIYKHQMRLDSWADEQQLLKMQERESRRETLLHTPGFGPASPGLVPRIRNMMSMERRETTLPVEQTSDNSDSDSPQPVRMMRQHKSPATEVDGLPPVREVMDELDLDRV